MLFSLLFSLAAFASPLACLDQRVDSKLGIVHAHRGMGHGPGENTLAAFRKAVEIGADVLELDLQVTKDSQLVIHHDAQIGEECRRKGEPFLTTHIDGLTLAQLKTFDCGPIDESRLVPGDHGIPTFSEFLQAVKGSKAHFNIELKANAQIPVKPLVFARLVLAELRREEVLDRSILQSFELKYLEAIRAELTAEEKGKVQLALLMGLDYLATNWAKFAVKHELQILSPSVDKLPFGASTVRALHAAKVKIIPYTPDSEARWEKLLNLGVDGMHTNRPKELIDYLKANPKWSCLTGGH